ncbi:MAG: flagellar basal body rod protein FlgB [Dehalococcoidia bacterium]|nr:flagellar basal body rod protein FlgB [Dehalococcoidia bacterium]
MNTGPLGDSTIQTARSWLTGLSRRQQAISDNIANIDTPGYVAKEVPFEQQLQRAIGQGNSRLATTNARHIAASGSSRNQIGLQAAQEMTTQRRDGNSVDIDQEMVSLAETQMRYQAAASALNTKIATLRNVIRGA